MEKETKKVLTYISILAVAIILYCTIKSYVNHSLELDFHNCKMKEMCIERDGVAHYRCVDCDSI